MLIDGLLSSVEMDVVLHPLDFIPQKNNFSIQLKRVFLKFKESDFTPLSWFIGKSKSMEDLLKKTKLKQAKNRLNLYQHQANIKFWICNHSIFRSTMEFKTQIDIFNLDYFLEFTGFKKTKLFESLPNDGFSSEVSFKLDKKSLSFKQFILKNVPFKFNNVDMILKNGTFKIESSVLLCEINGKGTMVIKIYDDYIRSDNKYFGHFHENFISLSNEELKKFDEIPEKYQNSELQIKSFSRFNQKYEEMSTKISSIKIDILKPTSLTLEFSSDTLYFLKYYNDNSAILIQFNDKLESDQQITVRIDLAKFELIEKNLILQIKKSILKLDASFLEIQGIGAIYPIMNKKLIYKMSETNNQEKKNACDFLNEFNHYYLQDASKAVGGVRCVIIDTNKEDDNKYTAYARGDNGTVARYDLTYGIIQEQRKTSYQSYV
eukprot:gene9098-1192_t